MFSFINRISSNNNKKVMSTQLNKPPPEVNSNTVSLFSQPFLDRQTQSYKNIVVLNLKPQGPLADLVTFIKFPPLSEFKQFDTYNPLNQCGYALLSLEKCKVGCGKFGGDLMIVDEVPTLISYLASNGYTIDTSITKMFNQSDIRFDGNIGKKLICFITYTGSNN